MSASTAGDTFEAQIASGIPYENARIPMLISFDGGLGERSGTFLTDQWVLTAAHCARNPSTGMVAPASGLFVYIDGSP